MNEPKENIVTFSAWGYQHRGEYNSGEEKISVEGTFWPVVEVANADLIKGIALFEGEKYLALVTENDVYSLSETGSFKGFWSITHSRDYCCRHRKESERTQEADDSSGHYNGLSQEWEKNKKYKLAIVYFNGEIEELPIPNATELDYMSIFNK